MLDSDVTKYSLMVAEHAKCLARIAELEADLADTLKVVLHEFGIDGAHKVTTAVLELQKQR